VGRRRSQQQPAQHGHGKKDGETTKAQEIRHIQGAEEQIYGTGFGALGTFGRKG